MRRTIENLSQRTKEKYDALAKEIEGLKKKTKELTSSGSALRLQHLMSRMEELVSTEDLSPDIFRQQVALTFSEFQKTLDKNIAQTQDLFLSLAGLMEANIDLMDAKDREWDALGSNHVGMIFKSMEWRVDKLAVVYEDVNLLMKKFLLLKEQLDRLLGVLEEKHLPAREKVQEILQPLKDWHYAAFENRHRGNEEEVKKQQSQFLAYFQGKGKMLDLGCGRGEFLEICRDNGIDARGIDMNDQMIEICRDKGLDCQKGDILETLALMQDKALGGIFSSQVIEHLSPAQLKRLIELAYFKLKAGGAVVFETINPASVFALVQIYFLDLSHQKPIHPQTLKFMLESSGFEDVEISYSQSLEEEQLQTLPGAGETASILNRNIDNLNRLLYAPPNYSALGIKK
jgi:2-polyprenyl-3-methyl-5-hydroxy-6-metoxy-1,4-benzoquinol methylase